MTSSGSGLSQPLLPPNVPKKAAGTSDAKRSTPNPLYTIDISENVSLFLKLKDRVNLTASFKMPPEISAAILCPYNGKLLNPKIVLKTLNEDLACLAEISTKLYSLYRPPCDCLTTAYTWGGFVVGSITGIGLVAVMQPYGCCAAVSVAMGGGAGGICLTMPCEIHTINKANKPIEVAQAGLCKTSELLIAQRNIWQNKQLPPPRMLREEKEDVPTVAPRPASPRNGVTRSP